jgi:glycosyltransferase involved in cell wall biosynthesis
VIYNGVDNRFRPVSDETKQTTRNKYTHGKPYFAYIGAFNPRKNITGIIRAFEQYKADTGSDYKLLLGGSQMYMNDEMQRVLNSSRAANDVIFTGYIPDDELPELIASAEALLLVSHFEGFGIPLIEAMKSGTATIAGNNSSMPEITGDAALLTDTSDITQISGAMKLISSDDVVRSELIAKGLERAELFTWENAAESLWDAIVKTTEL